MPPTLAPGLPLPLALLIVISIIPLHAQSPPGKPKVSSCRSFEKETVTCWWEPGSDGGLPTNYSLHYWTEKNKSEQECPDYGSSGPNSCFFDKSHSFLWMFYFVYVKATNALGSSVSDVHNFELDKIVRTYPPRNLTLIYEANETSLSYLLVKWMPPEKADVKMGWVTLQYEVRLKEEKKDKWQEHKADKHTELKFFSLTPGEDYVVQVRCKADGGLWSDWSEESYIQIPTGPRRRDLTLWISIAVLSVSICLTMIWMMALKGCSWMSCICPPVPGPKIMGFDTQLLKSGKSEDLLSAFGCQGFPPTSDCEDLLVEFLEVDDSKEHLMSTPEKDLQSHHIKVSAVDTDNDSGRGSCDSPFAPSEGSKDQKVLLQAFESIESGVHQPSTTKCPWPLQTNAKDVSFSNLKDTKSYIWPDGRSPNNPSPRSSYHNITDVCKLALGNINMSAFLMANEDKSQQRYFRTVETMGEEGLNKQNDLNEDLHSKGVDPEMLLLLTKEKTSFMLPRATMDYVEVHKVNQNDALALIPKHKENNIKMDQYSILAANREYSKVERVEGGNVLVLMPNPEVQTSSSVSDAMKEFAQKAQQSQAEKLVGFIRPPQHEAGFHSAGMGYLDPSSFLP